ncbi:MAG: pilus assembly protein PilM [Phycisphaerales bacterium JB038]
MGGTRIECSSMSSMGTAAAHAPPEKSSSESAFLTALAIALRRSVGACAAAVPMLDIELHSMRVPPMPDDELRKAVRYEAHDRFDVDVSNSEVEFVRLGEVRQGDDAREEIILVVAPHRATIDYLDALTDANLRPLATETPFAACARCYGRLYRRTSDVDRVRMVLHVGSDRSEVLVLRGDSIGFHRGIEFGGLQIDHAVADRLNVSLEEARDLRKRRMHDPSELDPAIACTLREAARPVLADLVHEAALSQRYYSVTFRGSVPEGVLLSGQNAQEPDLLEIAAEELKLRTAIGDPLEHIDLGEVTLGSDRRSMHPDWAIAVGLSLRGERRTAVHAAQPSAAELKEAREAA